MKKLFTKLLMVFAIVVFVGLAFVSAGMKILFMSMAFVEPFGMFLAALVIIWLCLSIFRMG